MTGPGGFVGRGRIQIDQNQQPVAIGFASAGGNDGIARPLLDHFHLHRVKECRVNRQQGVEPADGIDLVFRRPPVQGRRTVDIDFFRGQPFHPIGKSEAPLAGEQGAQGDPHAGVNRGGCGQSRVVVGFGKMDGRAVRLRYLHGTGQVMFDLTTVIILKQLAVSPVEISPVEQVAGDGNLAAEALQQKDHIGELVPDLPDHIAPGRCWDHVAGVAAKTIHTAAAPGQKDIGHILP